MRVFSDEIRKVGRFGKRNTKKSRLFRHQCEGQIGGAKSIERFEVNLSGSLIAAVFQEDVNAGEADNGFWKTSAWQAGECGQSYR